jgi:hypothetical protein
MRDTTIAIVLGGSDFSNAELGVEAAFARSAKALTDYLLSPAGFGLADDNLLNLFDSSESPSEIDTKIDEFLRQRKDTLTKLGRKIENVLIYYTGHGQFAKPGNAYVLALPYTRRKREGATAYHVLNLATTIRENARYSRRIVLLDCCFAASAYTDFQSGALDVVEQQTQEAFARSGTSLLCAAAPREPALARVGTDTESGLTVFSDALIKVLKDGIPEIDRQLMTLAEVGSAVEEWIKKCYSGEAPRPQVKSPDEREGDAARFPLFPNPARISRFATAPPAVKFERPPPVPSNDPIVVALEDADDPIEEDQLLGVEKHVTVSLDAARLETLHDIVADLYRSDLNVDTIKGRGLDAWTCLEEAQPVLRMLIDSARATERLQPISWTGKAGLLAQLYPAIQIACLDESGDDDAFRVGELRRALLPSAEVRRHPAWHAAAAGQDQRCPSRGPGARVRRGAG